jgi:hypothetical protein
MVLIFYKQLKLDTLNYNLFKFVLFRLMRCIDREFINVYFIHIKKLKFDLYIIIIITI